jgi:hypothetical protein
LRSIESWAAKSEAVARRGRVAALRAGLETREKAPVRLIETHISWVLLGAREAWKIKKPVRLPFLDFTALDDRRRFCEEELRLNRRLAPELYLDVVAVRDGPAGRPWTDREPVVDFAVRMRRFPDGALWSERLAAGLRAGATSTPSPAAWPAFIATRRGDAGLGFGGSATHARVTRRLVDGIDAWQAGSRFPTRAGRPAPMAGRGARALEDHWPTRLRSGRVRECHGDLHLANIVQPGAEATAFDAIEFDPELRWIDVLDDLAFPVMDLLAHGRRDLAFRVSRRLARGERRPRGAASAALLPRRACPGPRAGGGDARVAAAAPAAACGADAYLRLAVDSRGRKRPAAADHPWTARVGQDLPVAGAARVGGRGAHPLGRRAQAAVRLSALESSRQGPGARLYDAPATQATYAVCSRRPGLRCRAAGRRSSTRPS